MLLWAIAGVCPLQSLVGVLKILFPCYLSIRPSCYFYSHVLLQNCFFFFGIRLLVCPCAIFTNLLVAFSFVILESPVLSTLLEPVSVSFKSPFFRHLLIHFFKLNCQICLLFCFGLFIPTYSCALLSQFLCLSL